MEKLVKPLIIVGIAGFIFVTVVRLLGVQLGIGVMRFNPGAGLIFANSLILIALALKELK